MPTNLPQIGETLGHYRILEKIASGGMGVVYRAHDERLDRDVALKLLLVERFADQNARKRFRLEALTLSRLSHPNIATVFDFDSQDGLDFLVMEYVFGVTLVERLKQGALPEKEIGVWGSQIASALEDAHTHGIVHCDLKPSNIMLTQTQQVKLLDFGVAKLLRASPTVTTETVLKLPEFAGGTLPYMAPEQLLGQPPDPRADIYSVGIVLFEMAAGRRPFVEAPSTALVDQILHKLPPLPSEFNASLSPRLQDIILKCLEKEREDRYQSAKELAVDLRRLSTPSSTLKEIPARSLRGRHRNLQLRWVLALAVALLTTIVLLLLRWQGLPQTTQVVIMGDFHNRTNEAVLDNTIPELLTISLEQSGYISVFPSSRVPEVLEAMQRPPTALIDEATGREICQREALQAVIVGSVTKLGGRYVLAARAISPEGGALASTEDVVGDAGELPAAIDRVSRNLRKALGESRRQIQARSVPVAEVTSASLEAIRNFSAGKQKLYGGSPNDAKAYFEKALALDPSFTMAREYLGIAYLHQGNPVQAEEELRKTLPLLNRVSEREREKVLGDYSLLGYDFDQAILHYRRLRELRPRDSAPGLNLAQCYVGKLNLDSALVETRAALDLDRAPGPENNLAEIYLLQGNTGAALGTVEPILAQDPGNVRALEIQGWTYLLNDQPDQARPVFEHMVELGGDAESRGRAALADLALSSGAYSEAKRQLEIGIVVDRRLGNSFAAAKKRLAELTAAWKFAAEPPAADPGLGEASGDPQLIFLTGLLYAQASRRAEFTKLSVQLDASLRNRRVPTLESFREMLAAKRALMDGNLAAALESAKRAIIFEPSTMALELLGESYEASARPREAIEAYERVLARRGERSQSYDAPAYHALVEVHYHLGALYDDIGQTAIARRHLEEFLKWWSHPDNSPGIYNNAKERLRRLRAGESGGGIPMPPM